MKTSNLAALALGSALFFATGAFAQSADDCNRPTGPSSIPDGSTATEAQLVETQGLIRDFAEAAQSYLDCMEPVVALYQDSKKREDKEMHQQLVEMYNSMVDELQATVDQFNQAIRDFREQG